jgi:hypothetical protein
LGVRVSGLALQHARFTAARGGIRLRQGWAERPHHLNVLALRVGQLLDVVALRVLLR